MQSSKKHSICQKLPCGSLVDGAATNLLTCNWKNAKKKTNVPPDLILFSTVGTRDFFFPATDSKFLLHASANAGAVSGQVSVTAFNNSLFFSLNKKLPVYFPVKFLQEPAVMFLGWGASLA